MAPAPVQPGAVPAFVGLGANLGDAAGAIGRSLAALSALPQTRLVRQSPLYRSAPVDASGPDFINAVAELLTGLSPDALLAELQRLEQAEGRERPYRNAPRTLDLDLLIHGEIHAQVRLDTPRLTLPHPRMSERAFVLRPLADIAPGRVTAAQLQAVAHQFIERLAP
ncbi:MAG: 2-amino-4-hydroxy-6-hydroxymethyldihydropteridine diphosphokinase [Comamonadaceae bacterium]|nr:MAG: 2-amino-4-hydroxy-6-hydroxymethyldihydropteridine diphosphokinase [Comamonadaceae bacterium]